MKVTYSEDSQLEQFLADICAGRADTFSKLTEDYENEEFPLELEEAFNILLDYHLVNEQELSLIHI